MTTQDIMLGARGVHIRELKTQLQRITAENAALRSECDALRAHLDMAVLAAVELREGQPLELWDGWNLILGAQREAHDKADLIAQAHACARRVWIVFDGPDENVRNEGLVRISYTGGTGEHRADRFIIDFVRMAHYLGLSQHVSVRTNDKEFRKKIERICHVPRRIVAD